MRLFSIFYIPPLFCATISATIAERDYNGPTVKTKNGTYGGVHVPSFNQDLFLGVRYAQKVVRFTKPEPVNETWNDIRQVTEYKEHCHGYGIAWTGPNADWSGYPMSEDCLYLNIIRPAGLTNTSALPVALWIHGGGFAKGGGSDKRYNYSYAVQESVNMGKPFIGITINYRLAVWGWLMGQQAQEAGAVNIGYHDMRQSLRWVNENIAAFGGDPAKVTIVGESCGAEALSAQILAYNGRDDGLFRAAIGESGFGVRIPRGSPGGLNSTAADQKLFDRLVQNTSCAGTVGTSDAIPCLRNAPFEEINRAVNVTGIGPWAPVMDGDFIQDYPTNQFRDGRFVQVPILIGSNSDEGAYFRGIKGNANVDILNTNDDFRAMIAPMFDNNDNVTALTGKTMNQLLEELILVYPNIQSVGIPSLESWPQVIDQNTPDLQYLGLQDRRGNSFAGDYLNIASRRTANIYWSGHDIPNWSYRFDATPDGITPNVSAQHFAEVAYVFNDVVGEGYRLKPLVSEANQRLAKQVSSAWINMISDLNPNGAGVDPEWPVYNATAGGGVGQNLVFSAKGSFVEPNYLILSFHRLGSSDYIRSSTRNTYIILRKTMTSAAAKNLEGKTIVITGASSGIGRSTAFEFARTAPKNGLKLVLTARRSDKLQQIASEIAKETNNGVKVLPIELDVSDPKAVRTFVSNLPEEFRDIHVLVNNAGLVKGVAKAPEIAEEDINTMFQTNVTGLINMTQAILPIFKARRSHGGSGDIINVGSIAGREPYPGGSIYCATKAAVRSFTDSLRKELIATRIRVIELDPGQVETEFSVVRFYGDKSKADAVYAGCEALTPDDIADVIVFTASRRQNVVIADTLIFPNHQARAAISSKI
ncbi:Nn.00g060060.m01.CDS01 [Neocucurbitaria sp. VM-36]